jgi:hypothetical protein
VIRHGHEVRLPQGSGLAVAPGYDAAIDRRMAEFYERTYGVSHTAFDVPEAHLLGRANPFEPVACRT